MLRDLGFRVYRVRYHGSAARIEVAPEELQKLWSPQVRDQINRRFWEAGFVSVTVDLEGYRRGSLNEGTGSASSNGSAPPSKRQDLPRKIMDYSLGKLH